MDKSRVCIRTRITIVETVLIGQQDEHVRRHQVRQGGGEGVVITERLAQLLRSDNIVLVDDGHDAQAEELSQRAANVGGGASRRQIRARDERLSDDQAVFGERPLVGTHQVMLTDGGECLQGRDAAPLAPESDDTPPQRNRRRGHDDDLGLSGHDLRNLPGDGRYQVFVEPVFPTRKHPCAELGHDEAIARQTRGFGHR